MNTAESLQSTYEKNRPIVKRLYDYPYRDITEIVRLCLIEANITDENICEIPSYENPLVIKKSENDEFEEVRIAYYSSIQINSFNITFIPEHGTTIKLFDFATLEKVLNNYNKE